MPGSVLINPHIIGAPPAGGVLEFDDEFSSVTPGDPVVGSSGWAVNNLSAVYAVPAIATGTLDMDGSGAVENSKAATVEGVRLQNTNPGTIFTVKWRALWDSTDGGALNGSSSLWVCADGADAGGPFTTNFLRVLMLRTNRRVLIQAFDGSVVVPYDQNGVYTDLTYNDWTLQIDRTAGTSTDVALYRDASLLFSGTVAKDLTPENEVYVSCAPYTSNVISYLDRLRIYSGLEPA